jgi:hypothetical protein
MSALVVFSNVNKNCEIFLEMALLNDTVKCTDDTLNAEEINDNVITNYASVYSLLVYF